VTDQFLISRSRRHPASADSEASTSPRVRFTVRWMMVAVAVVGLLCGGLALMERRQVFLSRAAKHSDLASMRPAFYHPGPNMWANATFAEAARRVNTYPSLHAAYHDYLRRKYENAARHPWLCISPDPPYPE
jgi:hypothetical protein